MSTSACSSSAPVARSYVPLRSEAKSTVTQKLTPPPASGDGAPNEVPAVAPWRSQSASALPSHALELGRVRRSFEDLQVVREAGPPGVDAQATIRGRDGERGRRRFSTRHGARRSLTAADAHGDGAGLANAELRAYRTPPRRREHGVGGDGGTALRDDARDAGGDAVESGRERRIGTGAGGPAQAMREAAPRILLEVLRTALWIARALPCRRRFDTEHAGGTQRADRCGPSHRVGHDVSSLARRHEMCRTSPRAHVSNTRARDVASRRGDKSPPCRPSRSADARSYEGRSPRLCSAVDIPNRNVSSGRTRIRARSGARREGQTDAGSRTGRRSSRPSSGAKRPSRRSYSW